MKNACESRSCCWSPAGTNRYDSWWKVENKLILLVLIIL